MDKLQFRVLATDGQGFWELFFITQTTHGDIYLGPVAEGASTVQSRHVSGATHMQMTGTDSRQKSKRRQRLDSFRGMEILPTMGFFWADLSSNPTVKSYSGSRHDGSVVIDTRTCRGHGVIIQPILLEPYQTQLLAPTIQAHAEISTVRQVVLLPQTEPWVVLLITDPVGTKPILSTDEKR